MVLIEGATIIDGTGRQPLAGPYVIVREGRISHIGAFDISTAPIGTIVEKAQGKYLLPGLIDMHAHALVPRCGTDNRWNGGFDRSVSERMMQALLAFGITTIRSPATPTQAGLRLRDDINAGRVPGPRVFAAGELINGWPRRASDIRAEVRSQLPFRPDFIKLYGALSPEAVKAGIEEAHAHGIRVIGHLGRTSWADAVGMGIDFLTHAVSWSAGELEPAERDAYAQAQRERGAMRARIDWLEMLDIDGPVIERLIAALGSKRMAIDPTLVAYDSKFLAPGAPRYRQNPHRGVIPEMLNDWVRCGTLTDDWLPQDHERMAAAWLKMLALVRRYHEAGVSLLAGSDVTNTWVIPGESLHQELELLVSARIGPLDVIRIATSNAARALGVEAETGTVQNGKLADLILLRDDPLQKISNSRSIEWVMQGGRKLAPFPRRE